VSSAPVGAGPRDGAPRRTTVTVLAVDDPYDPLANSGTPYALIAAFRELGVTTLPTFRCLPRWARYLLAATELGSWAARGELRPTRRALRDAYHAVWAAAVFHRVKSNLAALRLRQHGDQLDAILQYGAVYGKAPAQCPLVTYEDMTVMQAARHDRWTIGKLSGREIQLLIEHQRRTYAAATACCTTTNWAARSVIDDYGVAESKVHVVGVGRNRTPALNLNRPWHEPRYLFVGEDWERKNGPRLLSAFERVRARRPNARLDIVGRVSGLSAAGVSFHGVLGLGDADAQRRLGALFAQATCFVLPSLLEPSGISYAEAMSAGIPVIGTTAGGSNEIIGDGGIVVDPHSEDALVAAMLSMAVPATASVVAARGAARAEGYTWEKVALRLLDAARGERGQPARH
jgi:glycosyltransferase involved in cell wall biosynthesis